MKKIEEIKQKSIPPQIEICNILNCSEMNIKGCVKNYGYICNALYKKLKENNFSQLIKAVND